MNNNTIGKIVGVVMFVGIVSLVIVNYASSHKASAEADSGINSAKDSVQGINPVSTDTNSQSESGQVQTKNTSTPSTTSTTAPDALNSSNSVQTTPAPAVVPVPTKHSVTSANEEKHESSTESEQEGE